MGEPEPAGSSNKEALALLRYKYAWTARFYDLLDLPFEHGRYRHIRPEVFKPLEGARQLLDCGVGTGRNIPHYPADALVTGIDHSPAMLARACRRAGKSGRRVDLIEADVTNLPFEDGCFDAAAATFLFCVLPDALQVPALREMARVVRPGGRIVLLEYTLSQEPFRRWLMKLWVPWVRLAYGASFDRRTRDHLAAADLTLEEARFVHSDTILLLTAAVP